ncbi:MAG: phage distal tail protein [Mycobacteriales bacterium]
MGGEALMGDILQLPVYTVAAGWAANTVDDDGVEWWVTEEDGWSGPPEIRLDLAARPQRDGSFDAPSFLGARIVTLTGTAVAPDPDTKERAKDRLAALLADGSTLADLTVQERTVVRTARVRLSGQTKITDETPYTFTWSVQLTAPDPLRYGAATYTASCGLPQPAHGITFPIAAWPLDFGQPAGGALPLPNAGTAASWPVWTVTGPCDNPAIRNASTGEWLAFGLSLAGGDTLWVDTAARTVRLGAPDGPSRRAALLAGSSWFGLPPGRTTVTFDARRTDTPAVLAVSWRDAWI